MAFPSYKRCATPLDGSGFIVSVRRIPVVSMGYTIRYVGIQVRDMDRSVRFYTNALGMAVDRRQRVPETGGEWAELRSPGTEPILELNWYPDGSPFFNGPYRNGDELDHIAFDCDDVGRAYQELIAAGARPGHAPFREGGSVLAYVQDPDGIWIELCERRSTTTSGD